MKVNGKITIQPIKLDLELLSADAALLEKYQHIINNSTELLEHLLMETVTQKLQELMPELTITGTASTAGES